MGTFTISMLIFHSFLYVYQLEKPSHVLHVWYNLLYTWYNFCYIGLQLGMCGVHINIPYMEHLGMLNNLGEAHCQTNPSGDISGSKRFASCQWDMLCHSSCSSIFPNWSFPSNQTIWFPVDNLFYHWLCPSIDTTIHGCFQKWGGTPNPCLSQYTKIVYLAWGFPLFQETLMINGSSPKLWVLNYNIPMLYC